MSNRFDVIVVGAGLGGLSAATYLAKKGKSVLLLERHNVPGGYSTSFVRGRFEFEVALHELSGIGSKEKPADLLRYLTYLGVADKVEFVRMPYFYRSVFPDLDLRLPADPEGYQKVLIDAFPGEAAGIRHLVESWLNLYRDMAFFNNILVKKKVSVSQAVKIPSRSAHFLRHLYSTYGDVVDRHVKDPRARAVIGQIWGYFGLPPSQISYLYFANAMATYLRNGPSHVKGRSQAMASAFVQTLEEHGGRWRMNCGVREITTSGERVTGVVTEEGERIEAPVVVSNADPITTCRDLIGADRVPARFFRRLQSETVAASSLNVYLGLAKSPEELGLDEHETFVNDNYDYDGQYEGLKTLDQPGQIAVTCYNQVLPDITPPGTSQVVLTWLPYGEPWTKLDPHDYVDTKNRVADRMIEMAERVYPGLRAATEEIEVSTPLTNMRYAGTRGGSIYGFDQPPENAMMARLKHWGPLGGLYFVGAWTLPGGGFEPAMLSGRFATDAILGREKKYMKGAA